MSQWVANHAIESEKPTHALGQEIFNLIIYLRKSAYQHKLILAWGTEEGMNRALKSCPNELREMAAALNALAEKIENNIR